MRRKKTSKLSWKTPIVSALLMLAFLAACRGGFHESVDKINQFFDDKIDPKNVYIAADFEEQIPSTVAILPLENLTDETEAADFLRRLLYNNFSSLGYQDIELSAVDSKLSSFDPSNIFETIASTHFI